MKPAVVKKPGKLKSQKGSLDCYMVKRGQKISSRIQWPEKG